MLARLLGLYLSAEVLAHLTPHLHRLGELAGGRLDELAGIADKHPPVLHPRNRRGEDVQHIEKHPAYEEMERLAFSEFGLAAMSHRGGALGWPTKLPPAAKYALSYLFVQAEFGLCCPVSMTDALARTLAKFGSAELVARYLPGLTSLDMDTHSQGAMFMTEQGAGSDVSATATLASRTKSVESDEPGRWQLTGDKWFCSNADAEVALVLARRVEQGQPAQGMRAVSLFLLPRTLPDGTPNHYRIVRLKDKLGTRSMASGEIKLEGAHAWLIGDPEQGFKQMADMINTSRLSNGMRAAGLMRRAWFEAQHVAQHRIAFGKTIIEMPLVQRQLAKMALAAEAARTMVFFAAKLLERADAGDAEAQQARRALRIVTPLLKFRACRDARKVTGDAMEMRGGAGYIEEWPDARLLRDAHLGSIWEGTSNIVAGDVLRATVRENALEALQAELYALPIDDISLTQLWPRVAAQVRQVADTNQTAHTRQAATALYYATAAWVMRWEATQIGGELGAQRAAIARDIVTHKLLPRDPLAT